jgi:hypothetical protein
MKMGITRSPYPYDAAARDALQTGKAVIVSPGPPTRAGPAIVVRNLTCVGSARDDTDGTERRLDRVHLGLQIGQVVVHRRDQVCGEVVTQGIGSCWRLRRDRDGGQGVVRGTNGSCQVRDRRDLDLGITNDLATGLDLDSAAVLNDETVTALGVVNLRITSASPYGVPSSGDAWVSMPATVLSCVAAADAARTESR